MRITPEYAPNLTLATKRGKNARQNGKAECIIQHLANVKANRHQINITMPALACHSLM